MKNVNIGTEYIKEEKVKEGHCRRTYKRISRSV